MKRRSFLVKSITGGMVLSLLPSEFMAFFKRSQELFDFPFENEHIRHGLFSQTKSSVLSRIKIVDYLEKNVFYKNGFSKGNEDLLNLNFTYKGKAHSCSWINQQVHFNQEEITLDINRLIELNESEPKVFALQIKGELSFTSHSKCIIIPIEGTCSVNNTLVDASHCLIQDADQIQISSSTQCKIIIVNEDS